MTLSSCSTNCIWKSAPRFMSLTFWRSTNSLSDILWMPPGFSWATDPPQGLSVFKEKSSCTKISKWSNSRTAWRFITTNHDCVRPQYETMALCCCQSQVSPAWSARKVGWFQLFFIPILARTSKQISQSVIHLSSSMCSLRLRMDNA